MALFRRAPKPPALPLPGPEAPLSEHLDAILAEAQGSVEALVAAIAAREMWVAAFLQPPGRRNWDMPKGPLDLPLQSSTLPEGAGTGLLVFSSPEEVALRTPDGVPMGVTGRSFLEHVCCNSAGLVLNPGSRYQVLLTSWIRPMVERLPPQRA